MSVNLYLALELYHLSNIIVSDNDTYFISLIDLYYNKNKSKFASSVNNESISAHRATGKNRYI